MYLGIRLKPLVTIRSFFDAHLSLPGVRTMAAGPDYTAVLATLEKLMGATDR